MNCSALWRWLICMWNWCLWWTDAMTNANKPHSIYEGKMFTESHRTNGLRSKLENIPFRVFRNYSFTVVNVRPNSLSCECSYWLWAFYRCSVPHVCIACFHGSFHINHMRTAHQNTCTAEILPMNRSEGVCVCVCMWVSRSVPWSLFNWIYIKSLCFETDCILHRMLDDAFALEIMNIPFNWCECVACLSVCVSWSVGRIAEVVLQFDMVTNDGLCLSWVAKYTQSAGVQFQKMWKMWIARASKTSCQR